MIFSTRLAFAALLDDGSVLALGSENHGDKIPGHIQTQLQNVKTIFATGYAFAALLNELGEVKIMEVKFLVPLNSN